MHVQGTSSATQQPIPQSTKWPLQSDTQPELYPALIYTHLTDGPLSSLIVMIKRQANLVKRNQPTKNAHDVQTLSAAASSAPQPLPHARYSKLDSTASKGSAK
jgi:hypothetical protein